MTTEEKELLLRELCARLPYKINVKIDGYNISVLQGIHGDTILTDRGINYPLRLVKPYLFPLSSMTKEQKKEEYELSKYYFTLSSIIEYESKLIDFYHKNHFDYRGLIPKGLAIDATGLNIY